MRNAVVRKKRLKAQRLLDQFMRFPARLIVPHQQTVAEWASPSAGRLWSPQ